MKKTKLILETKGVEGGKGFPPSKKPEIYLSNSTCNNTMILEMIVSTSNNDMS
jgi:hypothetical protein